MEINITAKDYFEELKLMKQQFGQEEDLYPWIYMLLQTAECKKRKTLGENHQPVSMRFVASASKADSVQGRKQISAFGTFPDIAIFSKDFNASKQIKDNKDKILGCVEAKKTSDKLISINGDFNMHIENVEEILELRPSPQAKYRYYRNISEEILKPLFELGNWKLIHNPKKTKKDKVKSVEEILGNRFYLDINKKELYFKKSVRSKYSYRIEIDETIFGKIKNDLKNENNFKWVLSNSSSVKNTVSVSEVLKENQNNIYLSFLESSIKHMICIKEKGTDNNQCFPVPMKDNVFVELISELLWYGKVIYTNGLHWKLLTLSRIEKKVNCTETKISELRKEFLTKKDNNEWYEWLLDYKFCVRIETFADLNSYYKADQENDKLLEDLESGMEQEEFNNSYIEENKKFIIKDDDGEWTKLIKGLANINWHE